MNLSWLHGWSLHKMIIEDMELDKHLDHGMFPPMNIGSLSSPGGYAEYDHGKRRITFDKDTMMVMVASFSHIYFHELAHSTSNYTKRWSKINDWFDVKPDDEKISIYHCCIGLEERIANIVSFVWLSCYCPTWEEKVAPRVMKKLFKSDPTTLAIPWGEVELAVKCYAKNTDCPKLESKLQYYKQVVSELTTVYEGQFNGTLEKRTDVRRDSRVFGSCIASYR